MEQHTSMTDWQDLNRAITALPSEEKTRVSKLRAMATAYAWGVIDGEAGGFEDTPQAWESGTPSHFGDRYAWHAVRHATGEERNRMTVREAYAQYLAGDL